MKFRLNKNKGPDSSLAQAQPHPPPQFPQRAKCYDCGVEKAINDFGHTEIGRVSRWRKLTGSKPGIDQARYRCVPPPAPCSQQHTHTVLEPSINENETQRVHRTGALELNEDKSNQGQEELLLPPPGEAIGPFTQGPSAPPERCVTEDHFQPFQGRARHSNTVYTVSFSTDGSYILSGGADRVVRQWDASLTRKGKAYHFSLDATQTGVAIAANGTLVAWPTYGNNVDLRSVATPTERASYGSKSWVSSIAFSPDSRHLAIGSDDRMVRVWDVESRQLKMTLDGHGGFVSSLAISPDGTKLVSGCVDKDIRVWSFENGELLQTLSTRDSYAQALAFSPDNALFASGSGKFVMLWNTTSSSRVRKLSGHKQNVEAVCFDPSGQRVASGSADRSINIWSVATGRCLQQFRAHEGKITSIAFSPNGSRIVSGSSDETVRIWDVEPYDPDQELSEPPLEDDREEAATTKNDRQLALQSSISTTEKRCFRCLGYINSERRSAEFCRCGVSR